MDLSRLHDSRRHRQSQLLVFALSRQLGSQRRLVFNAAVNFRDGLVDVTACEYDLMPRVKPGKPLESWVMIKLTSPVYDQPDRLGLIEFTPALVGSKRGSLRDHSDDGTPLFGMRMPATAPICSPTRISHRQALDRSRSSLGADTAHLSRDLLPVPPLARSKRLS